MAYLCGCDRPKHQQKLSKSRVAKLDALGVCGLPLALSALAHGDFPRSMYKRSKLLVGQLRSHASRAPNPLTKTTARLEPIVTSVHENERTKILQFHPMLYQIRIHTHAQN